MTNTFYKDIYKQFKINHVPGNLKKNQIKLNNAQIKKIETSIRDNYHQGWRKEANYSNDAYKYDLNCHLTERLDKDRYLYIPWLNKTIQLNGANILELGCGTGSSSLALAEQGANVTGVDIDEGALQVAKDRCAISYVPAKFVLANATDVYDQVRNQKFDLIIFFACIEHMIYQERIDCLRKYYNLLPKGKYLSIIETPNRLWYFDGHTSDLPFFNWLSDDAAYDYSKFSNRSNFKALYLEHSEEKYLNFLRRGRGFSFHEMEIALEIPAKNFKVASYLYHPFVPFSLNYQFHKLLTRIYPGVSKGFFYPMIDITIQK